MVPCDRLEFRLGQSLVAGVDLTDQIYFVESILKSENAAHAAILLTRRNLLSILLDRLY